MNYSSLITYDNLWNLSFFYVTVLGGGNWLRITTYFFCLVSLLFECFCCRHHYLPPFTPLWILLYQFSTLNFFRSRYPLSSLLRPSLGPLPSRATLYCCCFYVCQVRFLNHMPKPWILLPKMLFSKLLSSTESHYFSFFTRILFIVVQWSVYNSQYLLFERDHCFLHLSCKVDTLHQYGLTIAVYISVLQFQVFS